MSLLSETSPRIPSTLAGCKVRLADHQRAMIRRCLDIERQRIGTADSYGIMSDAPGTGKTYAILAMVLMLKITARAMGADTGANVIVAPLHIFSQWREACRAFSDDLTVAECQSLSAVSRASEKDRKTDIILTTREFLPLLEGVAAHRLILDEPPRREDGERRPRAKMTWYISASLRSDSIRDNECVCARDFVTRSFGDLDLAVPEPELARVRCSNPMTTRVLSHVLSGPDLEKAFACVYECGDAKASSAGELARLIRARLAETLEGTTRELDNVAKRRLRISKDQVRDLTEAHGRAAAELDRLRKSMLDAGVCGCCGEIIYERGYRSECSTLDVACERCSRGDACPWCRSRDCVSTEATALPINVRTSVDGDKIATLIRLVERAPANARVVIVSNHGFERFRAAVEGSLEITDDPVAFMAKPTRIMLLDPAIHGTGSNMHEATDVVFLHRMHPRLEMQVIGRASRPPRTAALRVWHLRYDNETSM